jgi:hypothetical protein
MSCRTKVEAGEQVGLAEDGRRVTGGIVAVVIDQVHVLFDHKSRGTQMLSKRSH